MSNQTIVFGGRKVGSQYTATTTARVRPEQGVKLLLIVAESDPRWKLDRSVLTNAETGFCFTADGDEVRGWRAAFFLLDQFRRQIARRGLIMWVGDMCGPTPISSMLDGSWCHLTPKEIARVWADELDQGGASPLNGWRPAEPVSDQPAHMPRLGTPPTHEGSKGLVNLLLWLEPEVWLGSLSGYEEVVLWNRTTGHCLMPCDGFIAGWEAIGDMFDIAKARWRTLLEKPTELDDLERKELLELQASLMGLPFSCLVPTEIARAYVAWRAIQAGLDLDWRGWRP